MKKPSQIAIHLLAEHFEVRNADSSDQVIVPWSDIVAIDAFKRDCFAYDCICVAFTLAGERVVEVNERMDGFIELMEESAKRCPRCLKVGDWYGPIMTPAFETKLTPLYRKTPE